MAWRAPIQYAVRAAQVAGRDMYVGLWQGRGLIVTEQRDDLDPAWYVVHPNGQFERLPTHPEPFPIDHTEHHLHHGGS